MDSNVIQTLFKTPLIGNELFISREGKGDKALGMSYLVSHPPTF